MKWKFPALTEEERRERLNIPAGQIRLVIDTDAKNEVDDQFAVSWALRSPERFRVEAVYAAPFSHDCMKQFVRGVSAGMGGITYAEHPAEGMEASYEELRRLFGLLGEEAENRIFRGSTAYISDTGEPVVSEAAEDLICRAMASEEPLHVAAIGAPTNIASALMMEPELVRKIVVIWLGGQPLYFPHGIEFNLMQDVTASQVLLHSGVPLVYIPCMNVASLLSVAEAEIREFLLNKSRIGTYLAENVLAAFGSPKEAAMTASFMRKLYLKDREDRSEEYLSQFTSSQAAWSRIIWDISTIAFLKNPGWTPSALEPAPELSENLYWGEKKQCHSIRVVHYCHRDLIFGDMFACLNHD